LPACLPACLLAWLFASLLTLTNANHVWLLPCLLPCFLACLSTCMLVFVSVCGVGSSAPFRSN
jgi:hypothetical protein